MSKPIEKPIHVAIIMDGNGRWAAERGLARSAGHAAGAKAAARVVRAALDLPIGDLTLFALSSDNWRRPQAEIENLLAILAEYLATETDDCVARGVRLKLIGRRDRLPLELLEAIEAAERATAHASALTLRIAVDYSSRDAIVRAARCFNVQAALGGACDGFAGLIAREAHMEGARCDVDLLIRSGGEQRLSDFLLWECAWAEIVFTRRKWPDFDGAALRRALASYAGRQRRFGGIEPDDGARATSATPERKLA